MSRAARPRLWRNARGWTARRSSACAPPLKRRSGPILTPVPGAPGTTPSPHGAGATSTQGFHANRPNSATRWAVEAWLTPRQHGFFYTFTSTEFASRMKCETRDPALEASHHNVSMKGVLNEGFDLQQVGASAMGRGWRGFTQACCAGVDAGVLWAFRPGGGNIQGHRRGPKGERDRMDPRSGGVMPSDRALRPLPGSSASVETPFHASFLG